MRRQDKLKNITEINKRLNESAFTWDGTYANEEQNESVMGLGDDLETIDEEDEDCGCPIKEVDTTDVESSQWFSDEEGERLTDKVEP